MATITTRPEPSSLIIHQAAIPLFDVNGVERHYAYNPWFPGRCYFQCFHCHAPLYREESGNNIHDEKCSEFPGERDQKVMTSDAWKIVIVFGTSATKEEKFQIVKQAFDEQIQALLGA